MSQSLPRGVVKRLKGGIKAATEKKYARDEKHFNSWLEKSELYDEPSEIAYLVYFHKLMEQKLSPGTLWNKFSGLNHAFSLKNGEKLEVKWPRIKLLLQKYEADNPKKKQAPAFEEDHYGEILYGNSCFNQHDLLVEKAIAIVAHFGTTRKQDLYRFMPSDVQATE
jgi:hypothetical protein